MMDVHATTDGGAASDSARMVTSAQNPELMVKPPAWPPALNPTPVPPPATEPQQQSLVPAPEAVDEGDAEPDKVS